MFVNLVRFPPIKEGKDAEFREWFAWSNEQFASHKGFIRRLLLKPQGDGNYMAIVEHENLETFRAMQRSPAHTQVERRVAPLLEGNPTPGFYDVVVE